MDSALTDRPLEWRLRAGGSHGYHGLGIGRTTLIITALLSLGGCATLRQFGPSVQVASVTPGQYIALKRGDILTSGKLSAATTERAWPAAMKVSAPSPACPASKRWKPASSCARRTSAPAELWLQYAMTLPAPKREYSASGRAKTAINELDADFQPRLDAWMQVARQAYAYLFFTERTANQRGFEDRQTQVRDYCNLAVQEASVQLYDAYATGRVHNDANHLQLGRWTFVLAPPGKHRRWTSVHRPNWYPPPRCRSPARCAACTAAMASVPNWWP